MEIVVKVYAFFFFSFFFLSVKGKDVQVVLWHRLFLMLSQDSPLWLLPYTWGRDNLTQPRAV